MPRPRILLFGSSNTDFSVTCPRLPKPGETLTGGEFRQTRGGKGANQAGDCFTGWLATAIAEGLPMEKSIPLALRAASLAVTRSGAQVAMPYRHEVG